MTYTRDKEGYMLKDGVRDMRFKPLQVIIPVKQPEPEVETLWEADTEDEEDEDESYEVIEKPKPKQKKPRQPRQKKEKPTKVVEVPQLPSPEPEQSRIELPPAFPSETFKMKSRGSGTEKRSSIEELSHMIRQRTMKLKF